MTNETKAFRIDWYPKDALIDFCELTAEEIGVCMQIINLIYHHEKSILNDPKSIGKKCNITRAKCQRIIHRLIQKGSIHIINDDYLTQKRCIRELKSLEERRKKSSKNGQKGAEKRWENQSNQLDENGNAIITGIASTSTNPSIKNNTSTYGGFARRGGEFGGIHNYNIDHHLSDPARELARINAPTWDQQALMKKYNERIQEGNAEPPRSPDAAYPAWCKSYTKGKPP